MGKVSLYLTSNDGYQSELLCFFSWQLLTECVCTGNWEPTEKKVGKRCFHVAVVVTGAVVVVLRRGLDGAFECVNSEARLKKEREGER